MTAIASFAMPDFSFGFHLRYFRFLFILLGYMAGFLGIALGYLYIFQYFAVCVLSVFHLQHLMHLLVTQKETAISYLLFGKENIVQAISLLK